jgi:carboxypeptidase C (cathepsin A)
MGAFTNYSDGSITSSLIYGVTGDGSREDGTIEALQGLLDRNVSVTIYVGDADFDCNWLGVEVVAAKINATGFPSAGYQNITTTDGIVRGQVKQAGKFSFVRVYQAGHYVNGLLLSGRKVGD